MMSTSPSNPGIPWWVYVLVAVIILLVLIGLVSQLMKWYFCINNPDKCTISVGNFGFGNQYGRSQNYRQRPTESTSISF